MKKWLICLAVLASNGCGDVAFACETETTAKPDSDCVVMPRAGARGVWFGLATADGLRKDHELVPQLQLQIANYDQVIALRDSQVAALKDADKLRQDIADKLQAVNETLARDATRAREERDQAKEALGAWYRSPFLWTGVGVVATVGVILAGGYAAHAF